MECPHCKYRYGWDHYDDEYREESSDLGEGLKGNFYTLSNDVEMSRTTPLCWGSEEKELYGCPSCGKLFIQTD